VLIGCKPPPGMQHSTHLCCCLHCCLLAHTAAFPPLQPGVHEPISKQTQQITIAHSRMGITVECSAMQYIVAHPIKIFGWVTAYPSAPPWSPRSAVSSLSVVQGGVPTACTDMYCILLHSVFDGNDSWNKFH